MPMTHDEFRNAYRQGQVRVQVNRQPAERLLSAKLLLPLFALPLLGAGVGLLLIGWWIVGLLVFLAGYVGQRLVKRSAPHFVLTQALQHEAWYQEALAIGAIQLEENRD